MTTTCSLDCGVKWRDNKFNQNCLACIFEFGLRLGDEEADEKLPELTVFWKDRLDRYESYYDRFEATQAKLKATQTELEATQAKLEATQAKLEAAETTQAKLEAAQAKQKFFFISDTN